MSKINLLILEVIPHLCLHRHTHTHGHKGEGSLNVRPKCVLYIWPNNNPGVFLEEFSAEVVMH